MLKYQIHYQIEFSLLDQKIYKLLKQHFHLLLFLFLNNIGFVYQFHVLIHFHDYSKNLKNYHQIINRLRLISQIINQLLFHIYKLINSELLIELVTITNILLLLLYYTFSKKDLTIFSIFIPNNFSADLVMDFDNRIALSWNVSISLAVTDSTYKYIFINIYLYLYTESRIRSTKALITNTVIIIDKKTAINLGQRALYSTLERCTGESFYYIILYIYTGYLSWFEFLRQQSSNGV